MDEGEWRHTQKYMLTKSECTERDGMREREYGMREMHTFDGFPIDRYIHTYIRKEGITEEENRFHTEVISPPMKQCR